MENMKEIYMNFPSDRNHVLEVTKIYHHALIRREDEAEMLGNELEVACVYLESTQKDLQEPNLQIYQLQKELDVPHLSSCMEGNAWGMMEELHFENEHEEIFDLQVLVKGDAIEYLGQTFELLQQYIQEDIPFKSTSKDTYFSIDWTCEYIVDMDIQGCTSLAFLRRRINITSFHDPSYEQGDQYEWHVHEEDIVMEKVHQVATKRMMSFLH